MPFLAPFLAPIRSTGEANSPAPIPLPFPSHSLPQPTPVPQLWGSLSPRPTLPFGCFFWGGGGTPALGPPRRVSPPLPSRLALSKCTCLGVGGSPGEPRPPPRRTGEGGSWTVPGPVERGPWVVRDRATCTQAAGTQPQKGLHGARYSPPVQRAARPAVQPKPSLIGVSTLLERSALGNPRPLTPHPLKPFCP